MPPGLVVYVLLVLITAQLAYAFWPNRQRSFWPMLAASALGFGLGQLWDYLGLPATRVGQADLLPGLLFAAGLQFLVPRLPITFGRDRQQ